MADEIGTPEDIYALFMDGRRHAEAADRAHRYLQQIGYDETVFRVLAESCLQCGFTAEAEALFRNGFARDPGAYYLSGIAVARSGQGDLEGALPYLRQALKTDPVHRRSWEALAEIHRFRKDDPLLAKLRRAVKRADLPRDTRRALHYAMAKAMNDLGRYDQAWSWAERGAKLAQTAYSPTNVVKWVTDLSETLDAGFLAPRPGRGLDTDRPVFVVGMPRSGTTLVEMILSMADGVIGLGEVPIVTDFAVNFRRRAMAAGAEGNTQAALRKASDETFTAAARYYLAQAERLSGRRPARYHVDKFPANILSLGHIALMFPKARVIRVHRNALDTCVSCYLGQFGYGNDYTYRPDWLANSYNMHQFAGDVIGAMIPNPVHHVVYEELVTEPERVIRGMLDFLGLPWDPACLTPEKSGAAIATRSRAQARRPINDHSVGRWKRYGARVAPLAEALGMPEAVLEAV